jgi:hypothetical protein
MKTRDNHYHFLDANNGCYRFHNAGDFTEWFPKYFHSKRYTASYIFSYLQTIPPPKNIQPPLQTAFDHCPNKIPTQKNIAATLIFDCLSGKYTPQNIFHKITKSKKALTDEAKQIIQEIRIQWEDKIKAHATSSTYYKSQRWFSDDTQVGMKKSPTLKHTAHYEDDLALLPRFFSERKALAMSEQQNKKSCKRS